MAPEKRTPYTSRSVHRVAPVTRGQRLAGFFWIQSMVRSPEQRQLVFEMDAHLIALRTSLGETNLSVIGLTGTYHNLLRQRLDVWVGTLQPGARAVWRCSDQPYRYLKEIV